MKKFLFVLCLLTLCYQYSVAQNVGIGTNAPAEKLEVAGNIKGDTVKLNTLKISTNAGNGKVLTSDINGNASWQNTSAGKAVNGLDKKGDSILLGGRLTDTTNFYLSGKNFVFSDNDGITQSVMASVTSSLNSFTTLSAVPVAQQFKSSGEYQLTSVQLNLNSLPFAAVTLDIKDNSGNVIGSSVFNPSTIVSGWQLFSFSQPLSLKANQTYLLSVTGTSGTQLFYNNSNPYPDGEASIGAAADLGFVVKVFQENSFMVIKHNRVGIGTVNPDTTLHIAGKLKITDGTEGEGKFLTSDASGKGSWRNITDTIIGAWGIKGNAGTNPALHFIGTTDNTPLQFRINNINAGKIDSASGITSIGFRSGGATTGSGNTSVGFKSLSSNTTGVNNIGIGYKALYNNTGGTYNVAVGWQSLYANTTGIANTAIGEALEFNSTGSYNTATGHGALLENTTGESNTANGAFTLSNNTTGNFNTGIGAAALFSNFNGTSNVAVGVDAMRLNSAGNFNTAIGVHSLYSSNGNENTAVGYDALFSNTFSGGNTAIGAKTLFYNDLGIHNTAIGVYSLFANTFGNWNIATGDSALYSNNSGNANTAVGPRALFGNAGGSNNAAVGYNSLTSNTVGAGNTGIGSFSNVSAGNLSFATAIGYAASVNASNKVRIGSSNVTVIEGQVGFSSVSDGRFKDNIQDDVKGIDFIMQLRPVSYNFNRLKYSEHIRQQLTPEITALLKEQSGERTIGFVAQDVEKAVKESGFASFDAVHVPANETDNYSIRYSDFVVPLVKAMQEQQLQIQRLKEELESLKKSGAVNKH